MTSAGSVMVDTAPIQGERAGSNPSPALQSIIVKPLPFVAAKRLLVKHHYLHSLPGGTKLAFGAFLEDRLLGAITFGAGPQNAFCLVDGACQDDCLTLSRLWLSDELPHNSESRFMGVCLRSIRRFTKVRFIVTYADPVQKHVGTIYQATGWIYTGLSEAMPKFNLGDGKLRHSRSLSHAFGSHSLKYFTECGLEVKVVPQSRKHRYVHFLDKSYRNRLKTPSLPYPRKANQPGMVRGTGNDNNKVTPPCTPTTYKQETRIDENS